MNRFPNPNQNQNNGYTDKVLICQERNCGQEFIFTARDQAFFAENQYTEPKRCRPCRDARKQRSTAPAQPVQVEHRFRPQPENGVSGHYKPPAPPVEQRSNTRFAERAAPPQNKYEDGGKYRNRRKNRDDYDDDFDNGDFGGYRRRR